MQVDQVDFADAFAKGLGRAIVYLRQCADPSPHHSRIARAFVWSPRFDWVECDRSRYIIEAASAAGMLDDGVRVAIEAGEKCPRDSEDIDESHVLSILSELARLGHADAHAALRAAVKRGIQHGSYLGTFELIVLDGLDGLRFVVSLTGDAFPPNEEWRYRRWVEECAESTGQDIESIRAALRSQAGICERTKAFLKAASVVASREPEPRTQPYGSLDELVQEATQPSDSSGRGSVRFRSKLWGQSASSEELTRASDLLLQTSDVPLLKALEQALGDGRFAGGIDRLVERIPVEPDEVSIELRQVAAGLSHPAVRSCALDLIAAGELELFGLRMLVLNYLPGDSAAIEAALLQRGAMGENQRHEVAMGLLEICGSVAAPECRDLLLWSYENTPCSLCRGGIVEVLLCSGVAPQWLIDECLHDCNPGTREMAQQAIDGYDFTAKSDDDK